MESYLIYVIILLILLALMELPLFTAIGGLSIACLYAIDGDFMSVQTIPIEMNRLASMPILTALPLFTFVGCLLTETGAPRRIMNFMQAVTGWMPGGLAVAALCSCAFFTALTGASGVTIIALGGILYPVMRSNHFQENFTLGLMTTSGSLGLLFPPSLPIILYGIVAQTDIQIIFRAALLPGLLLILVLSVYAAIHACMTGQYSMQKQSASGTSVKRIIQAFIAGIWDWPIVAVILIGIYGGYVTIAEVAAVITVYVIVVECFILREVGPIKQLPGIIIESAMLSGAIIVILGVALGFTGYLVDEQIPMRIFHFLTALTQSKYVFLAGLNIFLLITGCIMDIFSAIIIIVPIMVPIALTYGVDPIHLCIIFLVNLEIGYSTPPIGINLFISSMKFQKPVTHLYRASVPYLIILFLILLLITYAPIISLYSVKG